MDQNTYPDKTNYDITHKEVVKQRVQGIIQEIDYLQEHYKLAESLYPYSNLSGIAHVSYFFYHF